MLSRKPVRNPNDDKYAWVRSHEKFAWILEPQVQRKFDRSYVETPNHESSSVCWPWTGTIRRKGQGSKPASPEENISHLGYGWLVQRGPVRREMGAHRAAWLLEYGGEILPHQVVTHPICGNPRCVNPQHLELTTRRGVSHIAHAKHRGSNQRKKFCIRGHPLEGENLITRGTRRGRKCRTCELGRPSRKAAKQRELARRRAATAARRAARMQQHQLAS